MLKYVIRRLLLVIPTVIGIIFVVFTLMSLTPSSPGRMLLGASATEEAVEMLNEQLGYNRPFIVRFAGYLWDVVRGDLGDSYRTRQPVLPDLLARIPYTLRIGIISMIGSAIIGISLGILSAVRQYSLADSCSTVLAMVFASIPSFWFGMLLMLLISLQLGWLPSFGLDSWKHYLMPVAVLSLTGSAGLLRLTRTTMLETIRQDYIRTARAKGCQERNVVWKHALKNALLPVITSLGLRFGFVLSGAIITESVFAIPGVGYYMLLSIHSKDIPAVVSSTLVISAFFCVVMVLVDLTYAIVDPRIRERFAK